MQIGFEQGVPVSVDGRRLTGVEIVHTLNRIGGEQGVGRTELVEDRFVGMKSRGAYETPGGTLIVLAHRESKACAWTARQRSINNTSHSTMPGWSTTGSGTLRCGKRSMPSLNTRKGA